MLFLSMKGKRREVVQHQASRRIVLSLPGMQPGQGKEKDESESRVACPFPSVLWGKEIKRKELHISLSVCLSAFLLSHLQRAGRLPVCSSSLFLWVCVCGHLFSWFELPWGGLKGPEKLRTRKWERDKVELCVESNVRFFCSPP
mmetsp:Transcript_40625/g.80049  ORF Transcript_40625/g.80049 Transcript_40625/m.80049 type:complete len:144 (+) Transcript_40625:1577-2008(+)